MAKIHKRTVKFNFLGSLPLGKILSQSNLNCKTGSELITQDTCDQNIV